MGYESLKVSRKLFVKYLELFCYYLLLRIVIAENCSIEVRLRKFLRHSNICFLFYRKFSNVMFVTFYFLSNMSYLLNLIINNECLVSGTE